MDYALFISLALYGAYIAMVGGSSGKDGVAPRVIVGLLAAILFYAVLKYAFIQAGIQSP
jgi:hypothetical protein